MVSRNLLAEHRTPARTALAALALLSIVLGGCASDFTPKASLPPSNAAPYVGVFTGEFVDGKPLYRLPAIEIVGSRSSLGSGT